MEKFDLLKIDGHTLRLFASVCETGSVSRTAELFELNQSTVSHTIEKLRAAINDPLFVKSGRGITPTDKALALVPRVQRILAEIEGLVAPQEYDATFDNKPVSIAIPSPALLEDMRRMHARVLEASPSQTFALHRLAPRERVTDMLVDDEVDLVVAVSGFRYPRTLNRCHYGTDKLVVFYDPERRKPPKTIDAYGEAKHGVVTFGGAMKSEVEKALGEFGLKRQIALKAPTASMLGELIRGTDIVATMPMRMADAAYQGLAYVAPPMKLQALSYDLVWHRRYDQSGRNAWIRKLLLDATASLYPDRKAAA